MIDELVAETIEVLKTTREEWSKLFWAWHHKDFRQDKRKEMMALIDGVLKKWDDKND